MGLHPDFVEKRERRGDEAPTAPIALSEELYPPEDCTPSASAGGDLGKEEEGKEKALTAFVSPEIRGRSYKAVLEASFSNTEKLKLSKKVEGSKGKDDSFTESLVTANRPGRHKRYLSL
jgi:hypothetical protein